MNIIRRRPLAIALAAAIAALVLVPLQSRAAQRRTFRMSAPDAADGAAKFALPAGVKVARDVAYGPSAQQRFDVYFGSATHAARVIFMVHGGGWRNGDKAAPSVVENKVAYWVPRGFVVISVNYRLLPGTGVLDQARDVASALAAAQKSAPQWGGDPARFILMGHSAGAHLVALIASSPSLAADAGARKWLATVVLDSAALDVVEVMTRRHFPLYDEAFGTDAAYWRSVSPAQVMKAAPAPLLLVCSTRRSDSCPAADAFAAKASALGARARVLREDLSHREINVTLGTSGAYTSAVDDFVRSLTR